MRSTGQALCLLGIEPSIPRVRPWRSFLSLKPKQLGLYTPYLKVSKLLILLVGVIYDPFLLVNVSIIFFIKY